MLAASLTNSNLETAGLKTVLYISQAVLAPPSR
jgi:hypothetical protein